MSMAPRCNAIIVIGSANSSNTRALERLAREAGCERVFRINTENELPTDLHGIVGVTAGASAPEELVDAVIARLSPINGVEEVRYTEEDEYFPPPRNIRELQNALERAVLLTEDRLITNDDLRLGEITAFSSDPDAGRVVRVPPAGVALEEIERQALLESLRMCNWVQKDAAKFLGISSRVMNYKVAKYEIKNPRWSKNKLVS